MMKSWSNIVLILSVCAVVSPTPVPQYGFENILNPPGIFSAGQNFMNPLWNLPGSLLFRRQPINLQNPDNRPSSGLPGASNILAEGLRDTGAGIGNAISIAISTIANTLGTFLSGILGNGMVNDAKRYPPMWVPWFNQTVPTNFNATPLALPVLQPLPNTNPLESSVQRR